MSASVNLPLHDKVQKFYSGTGSTGWSWKKGRKTVVVVLPPLFQNDLWVQESRVVHNKPMSLPLPTNSVITLTLTCLRSSFLHPAPDT